MEHYRPRSRSSLWLWLLLLFTMYMCTRCTTQFFVPPYSQGNIYTTWITDDLYHKIPEGTVYMPCVRQRVWISYSDGRLVYQDDTHNLTIRELKPMPDDKKDGGRHLKGMDNKDKEYEVWLPDDDRIIVIIKFNDERIFVTRTCMLALK